MTIRKSRRRLLQLAAVGAGALGAGHSVTGRGRRLPTARAQAAPALPAPAFVAAPAGLAFGALADVAMGWDGTVWGIDGDGTPHTFDPTRQSWQPFGSGVDAVCWYGGARLFFRGGEVFLADGRQGAPRAIGELWPTLPPSFLTGVDGAANAGGDIYLFRGGLYTLAGPDIAAQALGTVTPAPLTPAGTITPAALTTPTPGSTITPAALTSSTPAGSVTPASLTTPTPSGSATPAGTPAPLATATHTPAGTPAALTTPTPTAAATAASLTTPTPSPASTPASAPVERTSATPAPATAPVSGVGGRLAAPLLVVLEQASTPSAPAGLTTPAASHSPMMPTAATSTPSATPPTAGSASATPTSAPAGTRSPTPGGTPADAATATPTPTPGRSATPAIAGTPAPFTPLVPAWPKPLTGLTGWPQTPTWKDGVLDFVGSDNGTSGQIFLFRGGELVVIDPARQEVTFGPSALENIRYILYQFGADRVAALKAPGVTAMHFDASFIELHGNVSLHVASGPTWVTFSGSAGAGPAQTTSLRLTPQWPQTWHPALAHAPSGRAGAAWAATADGGVVLHDGDSWNVVSLPGGNAAVSVVAGADGAVFAATGSTLHQVQADGRGWSQLAGAPGGTTFAQLAVGDAGHVWARDTQNQVHRYSGGSFAPVNLGVAATHIAANADGTLWHCDQGDASAYRFVSEGTAPPEALGVAGGVGSVQKVASNGFGTAWLLTQQNGAPAVFTYQSPYVFKTGPQYSNYNVAPLDVGAGALYLSCTHSPSSGPSDYGYLVALETQTGQERWRRQVEGYAWTTPVYDANLGLAYTADNHGAVGALDVQTGQTVWAYQTGSQVDAAPALSGRLLCFGDRAGKIHMLDTVAAQRQGQAGQAPTPVWVSQEPTGPQGTQIATPLLTSDGVSVVSWLQTARADTATTFTVGLSLLDAATGTSRWSLPMPGIVVAHAAGSAPNLPLFPPVLGDGVLLPQQPPFSTTPVVIVSAYSQLAAFSVEQEGRGFTFKPAAAGSYFSSPLVSRNGRVYAGASDGTLYVLDPAAAGETFTVVARAPASAAANNGIYTKPVVSGPVGSEGVFYAGFGAAAPRLLYFTPANGEVTTLDTGQTSILALTRDLVDGVVYAAGNPSFDPDNAATGQVFAIRADAVASAASTVLVESQLMQDFDDPAGGPGSGEAVPVARYQTHLQLVDTQRAPLGQVGLRIWADEPTQALIDGKSYAIGPTTPATVQTGADGSLTVISGGVPGGADADLFASPLRVWAAFMDSCERVVIYPDREFHQRLAAATSHPGEDADPNRINLGAASDYGNTRLFPDSQQQTASQLATSITQLTAAVGQTAAPGGALAAGSRRVGAWFGAGTPPSAGRSKYLAYDDLPGAAYFPADTPATRRVAPSAPFGLRLGADGSFAPLPVGPSTQAIDALDGAPPLEPLTGLFSWFRKLWDDIKRGIKAVEQIVISVAKDVYVGLQYIENGIKRVFKAVVRSLEDVVATIGAFFKKLGKDIKLVIQAIGILFNPTQIIATQSILVEYFQQQLRTIPAEITQNVIPAVDGFFEQGEDTIKRLFGEIKAAVDPNQKLKDQANNVNGVDGASNPATGSGNSTRTLFTVGPRDRSRPPASHAVQGTWAMHKLRTGQPQATDTGGAPGAGSSGLPQSLIAFATTFARRLTGDGDLKATVEDIKAQIKAALHASSIGELLEHGLLVLLDLLELVLEGALAVTNALIDGLLALFADLLSVASALLTRTISIPVLSSLYRLLFKQDLTLLNLITLVLAIPLNVVYRVATGHYLSADWGPGVGAAPNSRVGRNVLGVVSGILTLVGGVISGMSDSATGSEEGEGDSLQGFPVLGKLTAAMILLGWMVTNPRIGALNPSTSSLVQWGAGASIGALALLGLFTIEDADGEDSGITGVLSSVTSSLVGIILLVDESIDFANTRQPSTATKVGFSAGLIGDFPYIINPVKYLDFAAAFVVGAVDFWCGLGSAACTWAVTGLLWDTDVT